jgi:hypothetical protein
MPGVKTASWDARMEKRKKEESIKLLEKSLKDEKLAEEERFVDHFLYLATAWHRHGSRSDSGTNGRASDSLLDCLCRKREITKERKARLEEKKRLEEMAARMSAKKLQRMKKVRLPFLALATLLATRSTCAAFPA